MFPDREPADMCFVVRMLPLEQRGLEADLEPLVVPDDASEPRRNTRTNFAYTVVSTSVRSRVSAGFLSGVSSPLQTRGRRRHGRRCVTHGVSFPARRSICRNPRPVTPADDNVASGVWAPRTAVLATCSATNNDVPPNSTPTAGDPMALVISSNKHAGR